MLERGRGSVEARYTSSLDIEEVLFSAADSHVHLFVADVVKSFDTVDRMSSLVLGFLVGFVMLILNTMPMFGYAVSLHPALVSLGLGMGVFLSVVP